MPMLMHVLVTAQDPKYKLLKGKTLECITLMGIAVGKEMFVGDAANLIAVMQTLQQVSPGIC
jgi:hypothetical protein